MGDVFKTEATARDFVSSITRLLKPGGYFYGIELDATAIWCVVMVVVMSRQGKVHEVIR